MKDKFKAKAQAGINKLAKQTENLVNRIPSNWDDADYMQDVRLATLRGAHPAANLLLWVIIALVLLFFVWASFAKLDEATTGIGQVIPSSRVQVVQNLEGGIIEAIHVQEGDLVEADQEIIRIDDTGFSSNFNEKETRYLNLLAVIARLEAEVNGKDNINFPKELTEKAPEIAKQARETHRARQAEIASNLDVFKRQYQQKQQELRELQNKLTQDRRNYLLAKEEFDITAPLEAQGVVSKVEILRLKRQVNELQGDMEQTELAITRAQLAVEEASSRLAESRSKLIRESRAELMEKKDEASRISQTLTAVADQVNRTSVRAPMKGIVKQVLVTTVGGVIQPGMDLVEIIPLEDSLLVEAQVRPQDIAFLRPGLPATVKLTAYDYSIYGGLSAELVHISADTITNDDGDTFYKIRVRTEKNYLGSEQKPLEIIPGMVASVDILTGKKSVLNYLLKPFLKARENAFRER